MGARTRLILLAATVAALFALAATLIGHSPEELRAQVGQLGVAVPVLLVVVWALATPALFPGTALAAAGGLCLGTALGTPVAIVGATLGGLAAFLIARRFGHSAVEELSGERVRRVSERIERNGFLAVLGARVAPGVPATLLHYAGGLSRVRARDFTAAIAIGGAPRHFAYTALGGSFGDFTSPVAIVAIGVLAAMSAAGAAFAWRARRRARLAPA